MNTDMLCLLNVHNQVTAIQINPLRKRTFTSPGRRTKKNHWSKYKTPSMKICDATDLGVSLVLCSFLYSRISRRFL
ncbi:hypothetical protein GDO81_023554 [Engystomops pustulosus]|uniref:Uncharacterized protein n=1 Tax=Engystomops pustulosus TaxID=76066 RepID=A0AAV6Z2N9_ENGPU|nr:hypothetical protein GDO81_023554 [Engystomops pustulosus]